MAEDFNIWSAESMHAKILKQFNTPKSQGGFRCDGFEPYPKMLYKANRHPQGGKYYVSLAEDELSLDRTRVLVDAQAFNRQCQLTVEDAEKEARAKKDGWCTSQAEALQWREDQDKRDAHAAAHRNYEDRNLSEKALAESKAREEASPVHMGEIPEQPRKRRGRPVGSKNKPKQLEG